jgi:type I restriction enzyme, S subunit
MPRRLQWSETRLGAVACIDRIGVTPGTIQADTKYIGLEHIDSDGSITSLTVSAGDLRSAKFAFSSRHILYGKLRPYLRKVARPDFSGICSTDILPILPGPEIDRDYLYHVLREPRMISMATARSDGANLPRLAPKKLLDFPVLLPPLAEQRRIADVLDKADAIRRKRHERLQLFDQLLHSTFIEMFGDPITNPKNWPLIPACLVIEQIEAGTSVKGEDRKPAVGEWTVLKISAVTTGWYLPSERKTVSNPPNHPLIPQRGDLLFSRANTREFVAATCLVDRDVERLFLPDKLWQVRPNAELARTEYLRFLFDNRRFRSAITRTATGTSGSMLNVSQEKVMRLQLPVPPLALQRKFGAVVWKVFELRQHILAAIENTERLGTSLRQQAFG